MSVSITTLGFSDINTTYSVLDANGDGNDDLLQQKVDSNQLIGTLWLSDGFDFDSVSSIVVGTNVGNSTNLVLDANGDGKDDLLQQQLNNNQIIGTLWLSSGIGFDSTSSIIVGEQGTNTTHLVLDANGDEKDDLLQQKSDNNQIIATLWLSNGIDFDSISTTVISNNSENLIIMDVNNDGKDDLLQREIENNQVNALVWLSNGTDFKYVSTTKLGDYHSSSTYFVGK